MKKKKATFISVGCEIPLPRLYKSDLHPSQIPIPSKLICPICRNILLIPGRDSCNHIYCSKCFQNHYKKSKSCFITNQRCESTLYEVPQLVEELMNLKVYCIYRKKGCHWEGIYKNLQGHLNNECMKQRIQCPNCNCSMKVYRNELDAHKARCPHRLIMCNCGDFIELCDMEEHKKACLKRLVQCEKCEKMIEYDCLVKHKCVPKINTIITNTEDAKAIQQSEDKPNKIIAISDTEKENVTQKSIELQKNIINKKRNRNEDIPEKKKEDVIPEYINIEMYDIRNTTFDTHYVRKNITIKRNRALYTIENIHNEHVILLCSKSISMDNKTEYRWTVTLLSESKWMGIGLIDKTVAIESKLLFQYDSETEDHGGFILSTDKRFWNTNETAEPDKEIPELKKGTVIRLAFYPMTKTLDFTIERNTITLTEVEPLNKNTHELTPCVIFLNKGDCVEVNLS